MSDQTELWPVGEITIKPETRCGYCNRIFLRVNAIRSTTKDYCSQECRILGELQGIETD